MTEETYYQKNREKQLALAKEYQTKNRDYYRAYNKIYYQKNKDTLKAKHKEYVQKNKETILKNQREKYYPKNYAKKKQQPPAPTPTLSVVETMALPPIIIQTGNVVISFD